MTRTWMQAPGPQARPAHRATVGLHSLARKALADTLDTLARIIGQEFAGLDDLAAVFRITLRLVTAGLLGFVLGYERESHGKDAGVRTHMLVALGSAVFVMLPAEIGLDSAGISRVIQGLVAGVGFLCAGTILKSHDSKHGVEGLTTAAGLWLTSAIGVACGLGREVTAIISTMLALLVLGLLPRLLQVRVKPKAPEERDSAD